MVMKRKRNKSNLLQGLQICEDWVDLIEFIIQKFIQTMGSSPHTCAANMVRSGIKISILAKKLGFQGQRKWPPKFHMDFRNR